MRNRYSLELMNLSIASEFRKVAYINYRIPAEIIEKFLPKHTKPDHYNGDCMLSLAGFQVKKLKVANVKLPLLKEFDEVDLQIYVKRFDGAKWRNGIVVISRIFNQPALTALTNTFFKTNYVAQMASGTVKETDASLQVKYSWQLNEEEQSFKVRSNQLAAPYDKDTEAAFVLDRPYGYVKSDEKTFEYEIKHAAWHLYTVEEYSINVDFSRQFDPAFNVLNSQVPHSVILTEGSTLEFGENREITS
ncbi:DUF2071 domain-containing protein [Salinimicrobium oceani]|uniref:DUF2071 domain-containing protein n=1 Tax=Salinimicrobium oceani TaxID=2722702 RepID=A0ABX1CWF9_9FLAO|nr:DUF2071 domain-containing protein [Salinimicrobium oceani]NJW51689.1 hypothetical protein [Salinimicrobium oceani]